MKIVQKLAARAADNFGQPAVTLAFLGDSVTQGCFEIYQPDEKSIETVYDQANAYHAQLAQMLAALYPSVPVNIINAGVSGGSAPHGLERLERDVLRHSPDLAVVCFGLNDCGGGAEGLSRYVGALEGIFKALQEQGCEVIFMTPNMMCTHVSCHLKGELERSIAQSISDRQNDGTLDLYLQEAKKLCARLGVAVCDCYAKWQRLHRSGVDVTELLANHINHPTRQMNRLFAVSLLETIFEEEAK
ncbi:MAG: SGNH/GDSL hydrolase family protein [Clostridia bacterium]|nr:SGNH/GDSL hydrolase family protein [Clostridia bacterium]